MGWEKIGTIKKGDKGNYLKIEKDITLKKGQNLQVYNPRKSKFLTEEQIAKIPDFVMADVFLPPEKGEKKPE